MLRSIVTIGICAVFAAPTAAITVVPLTFEQLVNQSASVVLGRVAALESDFTPDRGGVHTVVTVDVMRGIKGPGSGRLSFVTPGGRAGRYVNVIPGAPTFAVGDVAVFFVTARGARLPVTTGFTQGIFRVRRDAANEMFVIHKAPVPLRTFEASIRAIVDAAR